MPPIWFILVLTLAFGYLLYETDFMRVRLPRFEALESESKGIKTALNSNAPSPDMPYYWMTPEQKEQHLILCRNCHNNCKHDKERWTAWKLPAQTINAFGSTLALNAGCNIHRANLLKDIVREHKKKTVSIKTVSLPSFVKQVRTGSHWEKERWTDYAGKKHEFNRIVEDSKTVFDDCLPGKDWLKKHCQDEYPEPTMEVSANGKTLSLNGDYKKGMIKEFVKANKA